jgi:hypothetical protein
MREVLHLNTQQAKAERDKLLTGKHEFYVAMSVEIMREVLPQIVAEGKREGRPSDRDAVLLYAYLCAHVDNRETDAKGRPNERFMIAWPSVDKISADLGIKRHRISHLVKILEARGLLETETIASKSKREKFYMPLYLTKNLFASQTKEDDDR